MARAVLLARTEAVCSLSKSELVRSSGCITTSTEGKKRLNSTAFYEALLEANEGQPRGMRRPGRWQIR
jgi:hypothetical protein